MIGSSAHQVFNNWSNYHANFSNFLKLVCNVGLYVRACEAQSSGAVCYEITYCSIRRHCFGDRPDPGGPLYDYDDHHPLGERNSDDRGIIGRVVANFDDTTAMARQLNTQHIQHYAHLYPGASRERVSAEESLLRERRLQVTAIGHPHRLGQHSAPAPGRGFCLFVPVPVALPSIHDPLHPLLMPTKHFAELREGAVSALSLGRRLWLGG
jgi:hypothetical protein